MRLCHLLLDQMHTGHIKQSIKPNGALIWSYNQKAQSRLVLVTAVMRTLSLLLNGQQFPGRHPLPVQQMQPPGLQAGECVSLHNLRAAPEKPTHGTVKTVICHHGKCLRCVLYSTKYTEVQKPRTTLNIYGISFKPGNDQGLWFYGI